jgi:hypothetical protein
LLRRLTVSLYSAWLRLTVVKALVMEGSGRMLMGKEAENQMRFLRPGKVER